MHDYQQQEQWQKRYPYSGYQSGVDRYYQKQYYNGGGCRPDHWDHWDQYNHHNPYNYKNPYYYEPMDHQQYPYHSQQHYQHYPEYNYGYQYGYPQGLQQAYHPRYSDWDHDMPVMKKYP